MDSVVSDAPKDFKKNYQIFKLDPREKDIVNNKSQGKRNFFN